MRLTVSAAARPYSIHTSRHVESGLDRAGGARLNRGSPSWDNNAQRINHAIKQNVRPCRVLNPRRLWSVRDGERYPDEFLVVLHKDGREMLFQG
jgi:hypothetical protein